MEGLKIGLEIHQQLDTKKLFCNCNSEITEDNFDFSITRRLKISKGESGEFDIAAMQETEKKKNYVYSGHYNSSCLVELDEEPPYEMNPEALQIGLIVAKALNATPVDVIQVMRKTVLDGSNTSGFQRTALIARNGEIDIGGNKITIPTVCIEEEACKIISKQQENDLYNLSRLGIPLIEISTGPDIKTPTEAKEVAQYLGMILRSTNKVKRGLGTIRQDLNVSIPKGTRVEIKGAQNLKMLPKTVEFEMDRQSKLLEIKEIIGKITIGEISDLTNIGKNISSKIIQDAISEGALLGFRIKNGAGLLGIELGGRRFGSEVSDYSKIIASVNGIFHSDELPKNDHENKYGITYSNVLELRKELDISQTDSFVIVASEKKRAKKALEAAILRINLAKDGVPKEVRKANEDGTTSYLRPLPGSARMYPETDIPLIFTPTQNIAKLKLNVDKTKEYIELGVPADLAGELAKEHSEIFDKLILEFPNLESKTIASALISIPKEIKTRFSITVELDLQILSKIFKALASNKISKDAIFSLLLDFAKSKKIDIIKYEKLDKKKLEEQMRHVFDQNKELNQKALISLMMEKFRGLADGKDIVDLVRELK